MIKKILPYLLAVLMPLGALGHIFNPEFYSPMIPEFISERLANIAATIAEAAIGIGLLIPATRKLAGWGFVVLMIAFLPIHIWDVLREEPAVGSRLGAGIRLTLQFALIYAGWRVAR